MPVLVVDACPRCGARKMTCESVGEAAFNPHRQILTVLFQCAHCKDGLLVELPAIQDTANWLRSADNGRAVVLRVLPAIADKKAPTGTPASSKSSYEQGQRAYEAQDYDAAGVMFRKALDVAIKTLNPGGRGNLKQRIDNLPSQAGVTDAMKEWAHAIRDDGNDAAHEDAPFTRDQAETLQAFTEMFLTYTFTLPEMVQQRREGQSPAST